MASRDIEKDPSEVTSTEGPAPGADEGQTQEGGDQEKSGDETTE